VERNAEPDLQTYHRVLNRAVGPPLSASRLVLKLLVAVFIPRGVVLFGLDDTIERRRGAQIHAKGIDRDPVRPSHAHSVKVSGLCWLSCMVRAPMSWANRVWALPFMTVLCPSKRCYAQRGRRHQNLTERAWQMGRLVTRWLSGREVVLVVDSSVAALELLDQVQRLFRASLITRLRLAAAL
jgi:DDE superfamily endonuclease